MENRNQKPNQFEKQNQDMFNDQQFLHHFMMLVKEEMKMYYHDALHRESERILLKTSGTVEYVLIREIIRCEAAGRYTIVFYEDNHRLMVSMHLKEMEKLLRRDTFVRCHNSHIINKYMITRFNKSEGGYFEMCNGDHVPVARARKEEVLRELDEFYRSGKAFM